MCTVSPPRLVDRLDHALELHPVLGHVPGDTHKERLEDVEVSPLRSRMARREWESLCRLPADALPYFCRLSSSFLAFCQLFDVARIFPCSAFGIERSVNNFCE